MASTVLQTRRVAWALLAVSMTSMACGGGVLLRTWSDPEREGKPLGRIAVLGIGPRAEARVQFEDTFVQMLRDRGNDAVASHRLVEDASSADRASLERMVRDESLDGVLTAVLLHTDSTADVVPAGEQYRPHLDGDLYEYVLRTRRHRNQDPIPPGQGLLTVEARLYAAHDAKLRWAGITRTQNQGDVAKTTHELAKKVHFQLAAKGYVE